jgi:hypothetical protein
MSLGQAVELSGASPRRLVGARAKPDGANNPLARKLAYRRRLMVDHRLFSVRGVNFLA